jgi:thiol-disulfide isomerase/thioredoxin
MSFESEFYGNPNPTLVMVGSSHCPPCKLMKPLFYALKKEWADRVPFYYVDVDDSDSNAAFAKKHNIKSIPTFILFHDGEEKGRLSGRQSEHALVELLKTC